MPPRQHALPGIRDHAVIDVLDGWVARYTDDDDESTFGCPAVVIVTTNGPSTYLTAFVNDDDRGWQRADHWPNYVGLRRCLKAS